MPTERHILSTGAWIDAGPTPCLVQVVAGDPVGLIVDLQMPTAADPPAHRLHRDGAAWINIGIAGQRLYLRSLADPDNPAPVVAISRGEPGADWASPPCTWQAPSVTAIAETDVPQTLFPAGAALHGGTVVNTSVPGTPGAAAPLWVDITSGTGAERSGAAVPVYPALDLATAPGAWRVPPTRGAVTVRGPAGATFAGFSA